MIKPASVPARRSRVALIVALVLSLYWVMAVSVSPHMGVTADEVVHLTGGYSYWKFNDYRLHPENGTLPMRIATLPWLAMDLKFPPLDHPEWVASRVNRLGDVFFFGLGNPVDRMLLVARMMIALLGVFTVWLTWRWARGLFGPAAGWVALLLAAFCPALLTHGGLATSDMALTACILATLSVYWQLLHRVTWWRLLAAAVACGLTFLSKMSGVFVVPLIGTLLLLRWLRPTPLVIALGWPVHWLRRRTAVMGATLGLTLAVGAGSLAVLWAGYGFRYDGFNAKLSQANDYYLSWDVILEHKAIPWDDESALSRFAPKLRPPEPTAMTGLVGVLRDYRVLPEAYLWGFAHTYKFSRERPAFLLGEYRKTGWAAFFPTAFLLKTTLPALMLFAVGIAALLYAWRRVTPGKPAPTRGPWATIYRAAPLLVFFVVYWIMAVRMHLNIGHRHILPTYPVFYVFAGAAACWLATKWRRWAIVGLVTATALHAADSLAVRPFYISYFQPLAGGVARGYHYLVDSSYDWGQGLPDLMAWLKQKQEHGDHTTVYLTYFGADSPRGRQLAVTRFGDEVNDIGPRVFPAQLHGGWFIISATHYQMVYMPLRGGWRPEHEALYNEILTRLRSTAGDTASRSEAGQKKLLQDAMDLEVLQYGRLRHFLGQREPTEIIGGSLLVFPLTDAEVQRALYGPLESAAPAP